MAKNQHNPGPVSNEDQNGFKWLLKAAFIRRRFIHAQHILFPLEYGRA